MQTQRKTYEPRVVKKVIELWVPHENEEIAFVSPLAGPGTYRAVGKQILDSRQQVPTGDDMTSLLYSTYCDEKVADEPEFQKVRDLMRSEWLWLFNRTLWTEEGVYVIQDKEARGRSPFLDINKLENKLKGGRKIRKIRFSEDGTVRFASKETYHLGEHTSWSLAKDGFIIASCGKEGAEKLGEVSAKFANKPKVYGFEIVKGQSFAQGVSAISECCGDRLDFNGIGQDDYENHLAFGVLK